MAHLSPQFFWNCTFNYHNLSLAPVWILGSSPRIFLLSVKASASGSNSNGSVLRNVYLRLRSAPQTDDTTEDRDKRTDTRRDVEQTDRFIYTRCINYSRREYAVTGRYELYTHPLQHRSSRYRSFIEISKHFPSRFIMHSVHWEWRWRDGACGITELWWV